MQNFAGMTATFKFPTPLVAFYGYNRTGKTNPIKAMKLLFQGVKQSLPDKDRKLTALLGESKEASLEMVFEFNDILYRLARRFEASKEKEYFSLTSSKMTGEDYLNTRDSIRDAVAFKENKREDIIDEIEVKIKGENRNTQLLAEKLEAIGLYPQMIDRLIAIENVQEFKNAIKMFSTKDGGYSVVRDLLSRELQRMQGALDDINGNGRDLEGKLQILDQKIVDDHAEFIQGLEQFVNDEEIIKVEEIKAIIAMLALTESPEDQLVVFRASLKELEDDMDSSLKRVTDLLNAVPAKREKYASLEGHEKNLDLELVETGSTAFKTILDTFNGVKDNLVRSASTMQENPPGNDFVSPEFKTEALTTIEFSNALSRNALQPIMSSEEIGEIHVQIGQIVNNFNQARVLFKRTKELKDKYGVQEITDVNSKKGEYENLKSKIENPAKLVPSEVFPLNGRVEGNRIQVYMPVAEYVTYIETSPFIINDILLPYSPDGKKGITKAVIKGIIDMLQGKIDELNELMGNMEQIKSLKDGLQENIDTLEEIHDKFESDSTTVETWNQKIQEAQTLASTFIEKYLDRKMKEKTFATIKIALAEAKVVFIEELKDEMCDSYVETDNLINNLDIHEASLTDQKFGFDATIKVINGIVDSVNKLQEDYKNWCRHIHVARLLHGMFLPTMIAINDQVLTNISIEKIEEELLQSIINHSQAFYQEITGENHLVIEREPGEDIYLKTSLRRPSGDNIDLLGDAASGSEQASIALGIMVALAKMFSAFVVIDETTDRFDYPTKLRFFKVIENYSKDIFTMIVLKVDTSEKNLKDDFEIMRATFPGAVIYQPIKAPDGTMTAAKVDNFDDFTLLEEAS